mgnify:CR=1 FL=1
MCLSSKVKLISSTYIQEKIMETYKITRLNRWTGKLSVKMVAADSVMHARCSKDSVSNHMMANGWHVDKVQNNDGETVYECKSSW